GRAEDNLVRFIRIRALLAAVKNTPGVPAERYRQQALTQMEQLRRAGGGWEEKVAALAETAIADPEKWSVNATSAFAKWELAKLLAHKGDYKQAAPLLEGFISSSDAEARAHLGEAHYLLGLAKFQAGQHQEAADHLDAALKEPNASYGADAAYVRFKALEALIAKSAGADVGPQYEQALRAYLAQYPDHKSAFEAQFRLGELLQAQRRFADASQAYAKVKGDPGFELRAQFATVQCQYELLQADEQRAAGPRRTALLSAIGAGLQEFEQQAADYQKRKAPSDQVPLAQMRAKAAIMSAVHSTLQPEPNDASILTALNGFEKYYPEQQDLFPQVVRLRLAAYQRLGRFADAEAEVRARSPVLASLGAAAVEELAVGFVREGARRNGKGDAAANKAAQQVALRLYELLVSENEGAGKAKLTLARLYENTGDLSKSAALYSAVLKADATSLAALRGLGRLAEAQNRPTEALAYWQRLTKAVRPGDVPWYQGSYEVARLTQAVGKKREACDLLDQLKPAMPGLSDADLRKKLDSLYQQTCR
ncbi:MAG: tetratricopeptide repeat protein, partial [Methanothrix sp.]|nr:tetratricopeptide repeat protein [Methanothrix sp.]